MEDAYTAVPFLLEVPRQPRIQELVPPRIVQHVRSASESLADYGFPADSPQDGAHFTSMHNYLPSPGFVSETVPMAISEMDTLHFFAVFDGHGGAEAALHCARTLHEELSDALMSGCCHAPLHINPSIVTSPAEDGSSSQRSESSAVELGGSRGTSSTSLNGGEPAVSATAKVNLGGGEHSDQPSAAICSSDRGAGSSSSSEMDTACAAAAAETAARGEALPFSASGFEAAFTHAFIRVDEALAKATDAAQVGTTAVVALVGDRQLYIGNCGTLLLPPILSSPWSLSSALWIHLC